MHKTLKHKRRAKQEWAKIAESIQVKREKMGLTQEELAEKLDISPMTLQFIEQSRRYPSFPMLVLICDALALKISVEN